MEEARLLSLIDQAVILDPFWPTVASHASPATQLALVGTSRAARDAAVQYAPKAKLTMQLEPPPNPHTLAMVRNSGRTQPTAVVLVNNDFEHCPPLTANHLACIMIPQFSCAAVTTLNLAGGDWLVDHPLLTAMCTELPALDTLVLNNFIAFPDDPAPAVLPADNNPAPDAPALAWPALRTVSVSNHSEAADAASTRHLLAALGVRAGGAVTSLSLSFSAPGGSGAERVLAPMRLGNQLHALRKLSLPGTVLRGWGAAGAGKALISGAPALEHLQVQGLMVAGRDGTADMCVPWRVLKVERLNLGFLNGLPLGSQPGQPPLILRVTDILGARTTGITARSVGDDGAGAEHLVSTAPGKRQVQLECTRAAYHSIGRHGYNTTPPILRVLTLATPGLSNLILDGIDSPDDIEDLVDLSTTGLTITALRDATHSAEQLEGLRDLPQVTKLELGAEAPTSCWLKANEQLLASLPAHITDVRLSGRPTLEVVSRLCVEVSRLPHRQAHPLRLCVPGVVGWFDAVTAALTAAGINAPGVTAVHGN